MLATTLRRSKRSLTHLQSPRRHGGSLSKNKHIENWNNWRGDSEKRFQFNRQFFTSLVGWGVVPFTLYYVLSSSERRKRDSHSGGQEMLRQ
ncbi:unnamed protein product [Hyaloperonospora brassicae]|uniref:NADH-ubiquinone oxidoreductase B15 subunit n=1 Tax=Hyaloperonospora brassicae TaxID=162125 RepID=A0AAV0U0C7_HYABA|nr:unnamed protein product [Hyaloperonospora brassicae]